MAQVIQTLCDIHLHADPEVHTVGRTFIVVVNGRARAMEMCTACEEELLAPLQALLVEHGRRVDAADMPAPVREPARNGSDRSMTCPHDQLPFKNRAGLAIHARHAHEMSVEALLGETPNLGMMTCMLPECEHRSVSRAALATHAANKHQMTLGEMKERYGPVQPRLDVHNDSSGIACPVCADGHVFKNRAGLATHADKMHNTTVAMLLNEPDRVKCLHCDREYENEHAMTDHARKHGIADGADGGVEHEAGSGYVCLDCDPPLQLQTASGMSKHRRRKHSKAHAAA